MKKNANTKNQWKEEKKRWKEEWDREHALIDAVLLAFDFNLLYDYPIPPDGDVQTLLLKYIGSKGVSSQIANDLRNIIQSNRDEYSNLERYMRESKEVFGQEWFAGFGVLSRWRDGEREKAIERVNKYLTPSQKRYIKKVQDSIRILEKPEPFKPMKSKVGTA